MSGLRLGAGAAVAAVLLALAACGRAPASNDGAGLPPQPEPAPTANMTAETPAPQVSPPSEEPVRDEGARPPDRFIVCPGNPRCPPDGSQPKGR